MKKYEQPKVEIESLLDDIVTASGDYNWDLGEGGDGFENLPNS